MNQSGMTFTQVDARIPVPKTPQGIEDLSVLAYGLIKKVADYPAYMPSVNTIEILDHHDNEMITRWDTEIDGAPLNWIQKIESDDERRELVFDCVEGDFDMFRGKWFISGSGGELFLNLRVEYKLGIPIIEEVLGPILKEKVKMNSEMMLEAIVERLASPNDAKRCP